MIDLETLYLIYKSFELECIKGNFFSFDQLQDFIKLFLRQTGKCNVGGDIGDPELIRVNVTQNTVSRFKTLWNITRDREGIRTCYDYDAVFGEHAIVCSLIYTLKILLGEYIKYWGHHDQVCMFYSHSRDYLYATTSTKTTTGTKKKQNANKTFTAAPTIYQHVQSGKVELGPTL